MCGICGIFSFNGGVADKEELVKMNQVMIHRGPDDEGYYVDGAIGMGMRRLSIIDLEKGHQPISNEDGRYTVILNGEIYNYLELKKGAEERGHRFSTNSDTEVLVHLFEDYGVDCVLQLNGMFAFSIWDKQEKELFLFRDRIGIKPLFYTIDSNRLLFGSELSVITSVSSVKKEIEFSSFLKYLGLSYVSYPESIFKNIYKLEPGHFLKVTVGGKLEKKKYWELTEFNTLKYSSPSDYSEHLLSLLRDSIRLQMRSDVPVGTFLSGGIDSSSIVALLSEQIDQPVRTFSVGFNNGLNELPYARIVSERFNSNHTELTIFENEVPTILSEIIAKMDEPVSDNAVIPTFMLSKIAVDSGVKVILNGTGGDEIFGGYDRYLPQNQPWKTINSTPLGIRKLIGALFRLVDFNKGEQISNPQLYFLASISGVNFSILRKMFKNSDNYKMSVRKMNNIYKKFIPSAKVAEKSDLMYLDLNDYLVNDVLSLMDKMTMAVSLEGRVPLLDHRIVELCFQIPDEIKFKDGKLKWLLKDTFKEILPNEILNLPKAGFSGPTWVWVNGVLKESIYNTLVEDPIDFYKEYIDISVIKYAIDNVAHNKSYAEILFSLYIFSLWYRCHVQYR